VWKNNWVVISNLGKPITTKKLITNNKLKGEQKMTNIIYKQVNGDQTTSGSNYSDIEGLSIRLPAKTSYKNSLITMNIPRPWGEGGDNNGINYQIDVDGKSVVEGSFTHVGSPNGRSPMTLIVSLPLTGNQQFVQGQWLGVRNTKAHLGDSASLSAILYE
jgi:hypothetical protein